MAFCTYGCNVFLKKMSVYLLVSSDWLNSDVWEWNFLQYHNIGWGGGMLVLVPHAGNLESENKFCPVIPARVGKEKLRHPLQVLSISFNWGGSEVDREIINMFVKRKFFKKNWKIQKKLIFLELVGNFQDPKNSQYIMVIPTGFRGFRNWQSKDGLNWDPISKNSETETEMYRLKKMKLMFFIFLKSVFDDKQ